MTTTISNNISMDMVKHTSMIRWKRASDGFVESHDGIWAITPLYWGCVSPQSYDLRRNSVRVGTYYSNQREAKEDAERILTKDAMATRTIQPKKLGHFRFTTADTVAQDLRAFALLLDTGDIKRKEKLEIAAWLNDKLDEWLAEDAFGTEGQCDPRGDHRD